MVELQVVYTGNLRTRVTHGPSGSVFETDAPVDNQGRGERFSPTDTVAAALGACALTIMGIAAKSRNIPIEGATARVEKQMQSAPVRRIAKIVVRFDMPAGIAGADRAIFQRCFDACPVKASIHPDIVVEASFVYPD